MRGWVRMGGGTLIRERVAILYSGQEGRLVGVILQRDNRVERPEVAKVSVRYQWQYAGEMGTGRMDCRRVWTRRGT